MDKLSARLQDLTRQTGASSQQFKPRFFRLGDRQQLAEFEKLVERDDLFVIDTIMDQLREFIKISNPSGKLSDAELSARAMDHLGGQPPRVYGVWVYYPWSGRLVHLLDRDEFIAVRTSRNQYKITPAERDILAQKSIGVVGLSVGQSVSVTLAMERICGEIRLADFDLLELTNLNRIRTGVHNLGLPKVYSVAREIAEIDPFIEVKCFTEGLQESNMDAFFTGGGKLDLLVEESDGFDIKILCRYKARDLRVPVIMEASDRCMVDVERFDLDPERPILHGIVKHLDIPMLRSLRSNDEKIPYMLDVLGFDKTTARLRASMLEMTHTLTTWPQLASAVTMGGGITADVSRRMLLGHFTDSGRYYVDVEQIIGNAPEKVADSEKSFSRTGIKDFAALKKIHSRDGITLSEKELRSVIAAAGKAPSFGNLQPWQWVQRGQALVLCNVFHESDILSDPGQLNMAVSCGAAIENAVQQAAILGYGAGVDLFPAKGNEQIVASITFSKNAGLQGQGLADMIAGRHTNRNAGDSKPLEETALSKLSAVFGERDLSLGFVTDRSRIGKFAGIAGEAERLRLTNRGLHAEYQRMLQCMSEGDHGAVQGWGPALSLAMDVISDPRVSDLLDRWDLGSAFSKYYQELVSSSGAIGFVSGGEVSVRTAVKAGMAAERVWLQATRLGLAIHPISMPLALLRSDCTIPAEKKSYLSTLCQQLSLIFSGVEATNVLFLFRVSHAGPVHARSPRRSPDEDLIKLE